MKYGFLNIKNRVMRMTAKEGAGLPDMNVTLNYENPTNSGIALITKAVMYYQIEHRDSGEATEEEIAEINDILYNPGYAPMERLARAIAFKNGDPYYIPEEYKSNYAVDFANDLERIAFAICPGMFAKATGSFDGETVIITPGEDQKENNL